MATPTKPSVDKMRDLLFEGESGTGSLLSAAADSSANPTAGGSYLNTEYTFFYSHHRSKDHASQRTETKA
jgi:hypothetical protein